MFVLVKIIVQNHFCAYNLKNTSRLLDNIWKHRSHSVEINTNCNIVAITLLTWIEHQIVLVVLRCSFYYRRMQKGFYFRVPLCHKRTLIPEVNAKCFKCNFIFVISVYLYAKYKNTAYFFVERKFRTEIYYYIVKFKGSLKYFTVLPNLKQTRSYKMFTVPPLFVSQ